MPRYKPVERGGMFIPVILEEQLQPGSFEFALDHLVEHELDLSALDAKFNNDDTGASAYDPRVMLKIVLLGYSRGLISSRKIEQACCRHVLFMAISGDAQPSYSHIARFVRELGADIQALFKQVLLTCDRLGLIGKSLFAIDGVKLPGNASKARSGTHAELAHRADRLDKAAARIVEMHRANDEHGQELPEQRQRRVDELRREAQATREFLARTPRRVNRKGGELKTNVTDPHSAKMATAKGVIQGYAAQAAVDAKAQVIVAADVIGSGSEQAMLLPMIERTAELREPDTLITADAGYHSDDNMRGLHERGIPALVADNAMRQRDQRFDTQDRYRQAGDVLYDKRPADEGAPAQRFGPAHFAFDAASNTFTCPAGKLLRSTGAVYAAGKGLRREDFKAQRQDCAACTLRAHCLRRPEANAVRKLARFHARQIDPDDASQRMRQAIDSAQGRALYSRRIATVEPVFANIRHHKQMNRFTLRGRTKVATQWQLYCLVHNIEKIAHCG